MLTISYGRLEMALFIWTAASLILGKYGLGSKGVKRALVEAVLPVSLFTLALAALRQ